MRKVIFFMLISLDGYFEGPARDISWHNLDEDFNKFAIDQLNSVDTLLFGKVTYEMMASYWSTPAAVSDDPVAGDAGAPLNPRRSSPRPAPAAARGSSS